MEKKEFSKFFIASLKRTAKNVSPILRKIEKLQEEINTKVNEIEELKKTVELFNTPIKNVTGGYGVEDLLVRVPKTSIAQNGESITVFKWELKYPETVIPTDYSNEKHGEVSNGTDGDIDIKGNNDVEELFK